MSVKISELPDVTLPVYGDEMLPLVQEVKDEFGEPTGTLVTRKAPLSLFPVVETGTFEMDLRLGFDVQVTREFRYLKISSGAQSIVYLAALNDTFINVLEPAEGGEAVLRFLPENLRPGLDIYAPSIGVYFRFDDQENQRFNVFRTVVGVNGEIRFGYAAPDLNNNEAWHPVEVFQGGFFALETGWFTTYPILSGGIGG